MCPQVEFHKRIKKNSSDLGVPPTQACMRHFSSIRMYMLTSADHVPANNITDTARFSALCVYLEVSCLFGLVFSPTTGTAMVVNRVLAKLPC